MTRYTLLALLCLGFALGCSKPSGNSATDGSKSSGPIATQSPQNPSSSESEPGTVPPNLTAPGSPNSTEPDKPKPNDATSAEKKIADTVKENAKSIKSPFVANPQRNLGWTKSKLTATELGSKVDSAISALKGVYGESVLYVKNKELEGSNKTSFKIKDNSTYVIQYLLPTQPTVLNRLIADGKKRVVCEVGKWTNQTASPTGLADWDTQFTKRLFAPLTSRTQEWTSVFKELASPKSGYSTTVEEKTMLAQGRTFNYVRIVAKKGESSTIEVNIDAHRFVPLTVRMTTKDKSGFETQVQWQAKWSFNNTFDPSSFKIAQSPS